MLVLIKFSIEDLCQNKKIEIKHQFFGKTRVTETKNIIAIEEINMLRN